MSATFNNVYELPKKRATFQLRNVLSEVVAADQSYKNINNHTYGAFYALCDEFKEYYIEAYENKTVNTLDEEADGTIILHKATIGEPHAIKMVKDEIQRYLESVNYRNINFPNYYNNLIDGIFEEQFGWGPLSIWKTMYQSGEAQVIGTDIFFVTESGKKRANFKFESIEKVRNVCERFKDIDKKNKLDEMNNPILETKTIDNIRVSIGIPSIYTEPTITLRRNTTKEYTIEKQASLKTIPEEIVGFIKILSRLPLNSVIAGPPGSGKNTFLVSMLSETIYDVEDTKFYVESSLEWMIRDLFPGAPVIHTVGKGEQLDKIIFPSSLRHDTKTMIVSEIRQNEAEIYGEAQERGIRRVMGTLHNINPVNIPGILARLNIHYHQLSIDYAYEYIRFAENLHFSITMDELNGSNKRVIGIQFYEIDPLSLEVNILRVMDYDWVNDTWTFNDELPQNIIDILKKKHRKEFAELMDIIKKCKKKAPMPIHRQREKGLSGRVKL